MEKQEKKVAQKINECLARSQEFLNKTPRIPNGYFSKTSMYTKAQARKIAKDMAQQMVNDILSQRGNVSPPSISSRCDEERHLLQEKQAYMDAFTQHGAKKRAHEIACQKLLLGGGNGSSPPSPPLIFTRHMSPSQFSKGNRRQPSPPPIF